MGGTERNSDCRESAEFEIKKEAKEEKVKFKRQEQVARRYLAVLSGASRLASLDVS